MLATFKKTMRYQLATFFTPSEKIPTDGFPTESINVSNSDKKRLNPMTSLNSRTYSSSAQQKGLDSRNRAPSKGQVKQKKEKVGYDIKVEKTAEKKLPVQDGSTLAPVSSEAKPVGTVTTVKSKATKRRAPAPPSSLSTRNTPAVNNSKTTSPISGNSSGSNPFEEDDGNPFLDDDGNPFLDDDDEYYGDNQGGSADSGNPFLNDEDEKLGGQGSGTGNPFDD